MEIRPQEFAKVGIGPAHVAAQNELARPEQLHERGTEGPSPIRIPLGVVSDDDAADVVGLEDLGG